MVIVRWSLLRAFSVMASTCKVLSVDGDFFVSVQVAAGAQEVAIFGAASETFSK